MPRSFAVELRTSEPQAVFTVPEGEAFLVTDIIALSEGNADGLLDILAGDKRVAIIPTVGMVGSTDLYGVHLNTGIRFESGERVVLRKNVRDPAWVTIIGRSVDG